MVSQKAEQQNSKKVSPFTIISQIAQKNGIALSGKIVSPIQDPRQGSLRRKVVEGKDFVLEGEPLSQLSYFRENNSIGLGDNDNQYRDSGC